MIRIKTIIFESKILRSRQFICSIVFTYPKLCFKLVFPAVCKILWHETAFLRARICEKVGNAQDEDRATQGQVKNVLGRVGATSFLTVMYKYTLKTH